MDTSRIIFLDCDGVLNCDEFVSEWIGLHGEDGIDEFKRLYCMHGGEAGYVVPELLERFKRVCDSADCGIVWSSSWREDYWLPDIDTGEFRFDYAGIARLWKAKGFPLDRLMGCTPCLDVSRFSYVPRGLEIQKWIDENAGRYNIGNVAILDDNEDAFYGVRYENARFFQTEFEHGLTEEMVDGIVNLVNGHFFKGLGAVIGGYFRNSKKNKAYEAKMKK